MDLDNNISPWLKMDLKKWDSLVDKRYLLHYPAKTVIIRQGQFSQSVYVVKSGRVMMPTLSKSGKEKIMMFAKQGGLFGAVGIFAGEPQPYSVITIVDCQIYQIPIQEFLKLIHQNVEVNLSVMTAISQTAYLHINQILGLSFGDIKYRIAETIISIVSIYGVPTTSGILINLPFTHQDMADLVKSSRVSVSKVLKEFSDQGILKKEKRGYIVYDLAELEYIVNDV